MYRIGLSTCGKPTDSKTFADYRRAGIEAAEISLDGEAYPTFDYRAAAAAAGGVALAGAVAAAAVC